MIQWCGFVNKNRCEFLKPDLEWDVMDCALIIQRVQSVIYYTQLINVGRFFTWLLLNFVLGLLDMAESIVSIAYMK